MSRPSILGIICLSLLVSSASNSWAQGDPSSRGITLADRLTLLKDKFRREPSQPKSVSNTSSSRPKQLSTRQRPGSRRSVQSTRSQRTASPQNTNQPQTAKSRFGINPSDVIPGNILARKSSQPKSQDKPQSNQSESWQLARPTSPPRAGSKSSQPAAQQLARRSPSIQSFTRKSPSTSRENELNEALADLLQDNEATTPQQETVKPLKQAKPAAPISPKSEPSSTIASGNIFDLRQALLNKKKDEEEEEVAQESDDQAEAKQLVAAAKKQEDEASTKQEVAKAPKQETIPFASMPQETTQDTNFVQQAVEAIKPQVVAEPVVVPAPVVKETKPVVTKARKSPPISVPQPTQQNFSQQNNVVQQKTVTESDKDAQRVFASPQGASNPMRSVLPVPARVEPTKQVVLPKRGVLQTTQQPVIVSHVEGPRSILVGQEATYQVTLENTSSTRSSDLLAEISVPEWAELIDAMSTSGVVERVGQGTNSGALQWKLSELPARSSQALRIRLIPRSGRPLQLGVRWSQAPVQSQAMVEVQEPKLEIGISGPQEVHFGKPQRYRLTLRNPGTGTTEKVSVRLVPPGGEAKDATTQLIGDLQPGEVKDLDLELTAREAGELLIQTSAFAEGGLKAEMNKKVLCLKPELEVDWRGPDKKYAGTVAAYYFRVKNPGTATTEPVNVKIRMPAGTEFISASDGFSTNSSARTVSWRLGAIGVGEEQFLQMRCKIAKPGLNDFEILAKTDSGELSTSKIFKTEVEALADLKLEVTDPQGPLPIGEQVVYQIRVSNRGTTNAEGISIVGLFSEGIDPVTVEGAQFSVRDGRVSFHPIKNLPAGRDVILKIHAKASQVGTHIFRAEVACQRLDIKLAAEETTRFFEDEHRWEDGETPYSAERKEGIAR